MENIKTLGLVTLYNPDEGVRSNILSYSPYIDCLIVWNNCEKDYQSWFSEDENVIYHTPGYNTCIAPALKYASNHALSEGYDLLLIMDQDSRWEDFPSYLTDVKSYLRDRYAEVFTPYICGCDTFEISATVMPRRLFINSGTVFSSTALKAISNIDEHAFPLDALDHDIALTLIEKGLKAVCLTSHKMKHTLGEGQRKGLFKIYTNNYNAFRTYSMTRSHIICYRKHKKKMTRAEKMYLFKEIIFWKLVRITFAESDKIKKYCALTKGIISGLKYKI